MGRPVVMTGGVPTQAEHPAWDPYIEVQAIDGPTHRLLVEPGGGIGIEGGIPNSGISPVHPSIRRIGGVKGKGGVPTMGIYELTGEGLFDLVVQKKGGAYQAITLQSARTDRNWVRRQSRKSAPSAARFSPKQLEGMGWRSSSLPVAEDRSSSARNNLARPRCARQALCLFHQRVSSWGPRGAPIYAALGELGGYWSAAL